MSTPAAQAARDAAEPHAGTPSSTFDEVMRQAPDPERVFRPAPGDEAEPVTTPVHLPAAGNEHTLTRRELRALRQSHSPEDRAGAGTLTAAQTEAIIAAAPVAPADAAPALPSAPAAPPSVAADTEPSNGAGESAVAHRSSFQPPSGHWSIGVDAPTHPASSGEGVQTRRSTSPTGPITTSNALIMPVVPSLDVTGPIATATGEVLVTGSVDLPRSLGSTGQHPALFDSPALDKMIDDSETSADAAAGVAPVRASKAISSSGSTRGMIAPPKPRDGKLPAILAITAAVLAVGVIGLLIAGFAFHLF